MYQRNGHAGQRLSLRIHDRAIDDGYLCVQMSGKCEDDQEENEEHGKYSFHIYLLKASDDVTGGS